ncbi:cytochrome P450 [Dictyobacter formicarum]|uniref:Cytochrome P450 n=1 Tax=Dictyobacter formicarum TaxID=2778368 RepID=A0ABQ3VCQ1_9CHLR|nr:cytochrome P450 [Dictyobacter formicarum]GHO83930.1 cytochrome P450 [Dictyobacter formicarum]
MQQGSSQERWLAQLAWCKQMREQSPVYYDEQNHLWNLFRYENVVSTLADPATFSSRSMAPAQDSEESFLSSWLKGDITKMDPPQHRHFRGLVSQAFTPRVVEQMAPRIHEITSTLLDEVAAKGEMDLVSDLSAPLPIIVIAELLGVPPEDRNRFKDWSNTLIASTSATPADKARLKEVLPIFKEMFAYLQNFCQARREQPRNDLISHLTKAQFEGRMLDNDEILAFVTTLLVAGNITTTILLGNAIVCLNEHPDATAAIRADPSLLPSAIEEILRYRPPFTVTMRTTTRQVTIQGVTIPANQMVITWLLSANHDERQFPEPERFDIRRHPNRHQAFGHGIHFCIGAPLARLEARIALALLFERFPSLKIQPGAELEAYESPFINGVKNLPVSW